MSISAKRARFVEEYIVDPNATQAAVRAGYSARTAQMQSSRLLSNVMVQAAIAGAVQARSKRTEIDQDWIVLQLAGVVVQGRTAVPVLDKTGEPTGNYAANLPAANRALELLGRHFNFFPDHGPDRGPALSPGSSQERPLGPAQVGYAIKDVIAKNPDIRRKILELDSDIKALTGGEGIVINTEGYRVE